MGQIKLSRAAIALALFAAVAGCDGNKTPAAKPELATTTASIASAAPSVSASASAGASAEAAASAAPSSEPASAVANAEPSAAPQASGSANASASATPQAKTAPKLPTAPRGILAAGEADRIAKLGSAPLLKLLDAGAEPREKITYAFTKGATQKVEIVLDIGVKLTAAGQNVPAGNMPRMTMLMELTAGDKNDAGDVLVTGKLVKLGLEPEGADQKQIADALKTELDSIKGLPLSYFVTPRGRTHDLKMDASKFGTGAEQVMQGMTQSMASMVTQFPDEAIGLGASWQVVSRISSAGADILQYETYTLDKRESSKLGLSVSIAQLAATDKVGVPGMPGGASATLTSFRSVGSGDREADTKKLAAEKGTMKMNSAIDLSVSQPGQETQSTRVDTNLVARFRKPK
jgi:hypothetical protein